MVVGVFSCGLEYWIIYWITIFFYSIQKNYLFRWHGILKIKVTFMFSNKNVTILYFTSHHSRQWYQSTIWLLIYFMKFRITFIFTLSSIKYMQSDRRKLLIMNRLKLLLESNGGIMTLVPGYFGIIRYFQNIY